MFDLSQTKPKLGQVQTFHIDDVIDELWSDIDARKHIRVSSVLPFETEALIPYIAR